MTAKFTKLALAAAAAFSLSSAQALVLDFEDLPAGTAVFPGTPVTAGLQESADYHGFTFQYWNGPRTSPCLDCEGSWYYSDAPIAVNPVTGAGTSWVNPGNTSISTDFSLPIGAEVSSYSIKSAAPVYFQGFSALGTSGLVDITAYFYLGGVAVGSSSVLTLTENASLQGNPVNWTSADFFNASSVFTPMPGGVLADEVQIYGYQGYWAIDDIVYAPVPEASTYAMMGLGLLALGGIARRRAAKR